MSSPVFRKLIAAVSASVLGLSLAACSGEAKDSADDVIIESTVVTYGPQTETSTSESTSVKATTTQRSSSSDTLPLFPHEEERLKESARFDCLDPLLAERSGLKITSIDNESVELLESPKIPGAGMVSLTSEMSYTENGSDFGPEDFSCVFIFERDKDVSLNFDSSVIEWHLTPRP